MTLFDWNHSQVKNFFDYLGLKSVSEGTIKRYKRVLGSYSTKPIYTCLSDPIAKKIALSIPTAADSLEAEEKALGVKNSKGKYNEGLNYWSDFVSDVLEWP